MQTFALGNTVELLRSTSPLVHCITNYVTVNDCANVLLAVGASPVMSDEPDDVSDITSIANALVLNIGTLNSRSIKAMHIAGARAAELGHPIVLDPVGAGASQLRTRTAAELLDELPVAVIRCNMSEAKALAGGAAKTHGVDACADDAVTEDNLPECVDFVRGLAEKTNAIVAVTGAIDIIASAEHAFGVANGTPQMSRITGTGCMLSCLCAAFAAANPEAMLESQVAAVVSMGLAGQTAAARMMGFDGTGAFRSYLIDALSYVDSAQIEAEAIVEEI